MDKKKLIVLAVVVALVAAWVGLGGSEFLNFTTIKAKQAEWYVLYQGNPLQVIAVYFLVYVLVTGLSLPGAAVMTLLAGALFGVAMGTLVVSFASTLGATVAFLVARYVARDTVQRRFAAQLSTINQGVEKEGAFYLFSLRLVPLFPFFLINIVMGLTPLRAWTFYWVSQVGMLAGTVVYVNAGTQLAQLDSLKGILSPGLLISFSLLGLLPLIAKKLVGLLRKGKAPVPEVASSSSSGGAPTLASSFTKPKKFDRNLIVIGAGAAGLVTSYIAAAVKAKVTLIEGHAMGGDCLNTGCVPSKSLIRSAKIVNYIDRSREFGLKPTLPSFDFAEVMDRVHRTIKAIEPHDSVARYTDLGVECIQGYARFVSPWEVAVNGQTLSAPNIVIATGAKPYVPPIPGLEAVGYLTSDTVWNLRAKPKRMVVLGGGPIGSELSQAFARLGVDITQIEMMPRLLMREDEEVSQQVADSLRRDGVTVLTDHKVVGAERIARDKVVICQHRGQQVAVHCDEILVAVGRAANTGGLNLELLGLEKNTNGTLAVDDYLRTTRQPHILACGDVAGPYQFTHTAAHQAWYASVNGLFGRFKKFKVDYSVIPWCTFTDPEVARVGINELEAKERNIPYDVVTYGIDDLDRAICDEEAHGFVKVLTQPGKDKILGVTIVGHHAGDLIAEFVLAMKHGLGLNKLLGTIHIYPTWTEANRYAAGQWKQMNKPEFALKMLEKFHAWRRG